MTEVAKTTHQFQAEVTRVLSLVINSLYSHREIFLRELISNASDALDKLRFLALTDSSLTPGDESLKVRIVPDKDAGTLTIWDNGIGMDAEALQDQLGTIARSGTQGFLEKLEAAKKSDVQLIGQFGVGFYSSYLVADRVDVVSRAAGQEKAYRWSSEGHDSFTIEEAERSSPGTSVVLHLKEEEKKYFDEYQLRHLVQKYSDYLSYDIELRVEKSGEKKFETVNRGNALWQRRPSEVTDAQYEEFYKHLTHDWEAPLAHKHFKVEGTQMFAGLLFIPKQQPFDLFAPESRHGVRLHVRRVFIMDDCDDLLPKWLRFVRGVVDSDDLPLNVSRELLQDSRLVQVIRKQVIKQTLDLLESMAKEKNEDYAKFWAAFGPVLKEGLHFDAVAYGERLRDLVRYESTRAEGCVSLAEYKERMVEGQRAIYYILGESRAALESSPHLEALRKRNYEVLYMTDPVDSFAVSALEEYDGVPLISATGSDLKLDDEDEADDECLKSLIDRFRIRLQDHVREVRLSKRLTESPVCLVVPDGGLQPHLERLLRAAQGGEGPRTKRILEINPQHKVVRQLETLHERDPKSDEVSNWIDLLFEQALLAEGSPIENPARFAARVTDLLERATTQAVG